MTSPFPPLLRRNPRLLIKRQHIRCDLLRRVQGIQVAIAGQIDTYKNARECGETPRKLKKKNMETQWIFFDQIGKKNKKCVKKKHGNQMGGGFDKKLVPFLCRVRWCHKFSLLILVKLPQVELQAGLVFHGSMETCFIPAPKIKNHTHSNAMFMQIYFLVDGPTMY